MSDDNFAYVMRPDGTIEVLPPDHEQRRADMVNAIGAAVVDGPVALMPILGDLSLSADYRWGVFREAIGIATSEMAARASTYELRLFVGRLQLIIMSARMTTGFPFQGEGDHGGQ